MARSDRHVDVALNNEEYELISEIAKNKGISRGNVFKALMFEEYGDKYSLLHELKQANDTNSYTNKKIGELQTELAKYESNIVKIGINANQVAKAMNTIAKGSNVNDEDVRAVLSALETIHEDLHELDNLVGDIATSYMARGSYGNGED